MTGSLNPRLTIPQRLLDLAHKRHPRARTWYSATRNIYRWTARCNICDEHIVSWSTSYPKPKYVDRSLATHYRWHWEQLEEQ